MYLSNQPSQKKILHKLEQHNLLKQQQHGFLKGRSTMTAIVQLVEDIIDKIEEGRIVSTLFLDFSKAFDCLNFSRLVSQLSERQETPVRVALYY